jgi:tRNA pseudouridine55 synthase
LDTPYQPSGILLIDKPANMTSAKVVSRVKRLLGANKVGHGGTLDPFATGVLICCINRATRIARFFLNGEKTYQAVLHLGVETDTHDPTGTVISRCDVDHFSEAQLKAVIRQFEGTIEQTPPSFSALKHNGVPLYKLARRGLQVKKPPRTVHIAYIKILGIELPRVRLEIACSSGTYIRSLAVDIGRELKCGGHLSALRRIKSSGFDLQETIPVSDLDAFAEKGKLPGMIIGMANALWHIPAYIADDILVNKIRYGQKIEITDIEPDRIVSKTDKFNSFIKVMNNDNELLAVLSNSHSEPCYRYCGVFQ